jgi:Abortive infection C-terminus
MSLLTGIERGKLERLLCMGTGYVSNFSDSTFEAFFADFDIDIHNDKYTGTGTSKAKKLRQFWKLESDHLVGTTIAALVKHVEDNPHPFDPISGDDKAALIRDCKTIASRLMAGKIDLGHLKKATACFDAKHLAEQIHRIERSIDSDPALAIGSAKELIETCCKTILAERGKPVSGTPDIPTLTKHTLRELKLVPEGVHEATRGVDVLRRLLQSLGTIGNNLAELRGLYGTGHGKHGEFEGLLPHHARLAVGCAATLVTFLFDAHKTSPGGTP